MPRSTAFRSQVTLADGFNTKCTQGNVHDTTPTAAQLITEFGTAASRGAGFIGTVDDAAGSTNFYLVATDGVAYFWTKMTKAL